VVGVGLLVTNCTIKADDSCTPGEKKNCSDCDHDVTGTQTCQADGTYAACFCPGSVNGGGSNAGASSVAGGSSGGASSSGASSGGASSNHAGEGGASELAGSAGDSEGGAGGEAAFTIDPTNCYTCLEHFCAPEWAACAADNETTVLSSGDPYCLSQGASADPGQIELIMTCITTERAKGLVKRDVVRACGSTIGVSADPQFFAWAPQEMTPATEALMNCMADKPDEVDNQGAWATDASNFPSSGPRPWDDMTCAKFSCTSAL